MPDYEKDGWCLEDGEQLHREAPKTFLIPDLALRQILQPGDFAKLVFRIAVESEDEPCTVERMWVIIRERVAAGYIGILDNIPTKISENKDFWLGTEPPFEARHIIAVDHANAESMRLAGEPAPIPWRRS